jgi:hypothetical protein
VSDVIPGSVRNQRTIEAAPKIPDDAQQLVVMVLQAQRDTPPVSSGKARVALRALREPLARAYIGDLREAYTACQMADDVVALLAAVQRLETTEDAEPHKPATQSRTRDELHLICY